MKTPEEWAENIVYKLGFTAPEVKNERLKELIQEAIKRAISDEHVRIATIMMTTLPNLHWTQIWEDMIPSERGEVEGEAQVKREDK